METPQKYIDDFNPVAYYQTYYAQGTENVVGEWLDFALQILHETFTPGGVEGDTLIDLGSGPTIYQLLSACEVFNNIITSDYLEQNCAELQKWIRKDPNALDWTHLIKYVCELEGNRENFEEKAEKLRSKMKQVLKCDALKTNPYEPLVLSPADCLITCLCIEVPSKDMESYCNILKNLKNLIKPGGHLLVLSMLNSSFYYVGNKRFDCFFITSKNDLEMAFKEAGYEIERIVVTPRKNKSSMDICGHDSHYYVHARKPL